MKHYEWQDVLAYLQQWIKRSEQRGDPIFMQASLNAAYFLLLSCWMFEKHLENPRALAVRICQWCKMDFRPSVAWQTACGKCDDTDQEYPPLNVEHLVEKAMRELKRLDETEMAKL